MEAHRGGITSSSIFLVLRFIICPILLLSRWDGHLWKPRAPNMESHRSGGSSLFLVIRFILWPCDVVIHCASFLYWSWLKLLITIIGNTLEQCWWTLVGTHYYRVGYASWELVNRQLGVAVTGHQLPAYVTIVRRAESHTRTKISGNIDALNKHLSVAKHSRLTP